jgi:hypothetical protein
MATIPISQSTSATQRVIVVQTNRDEPRHTLVLDRSVGLSEGVDMKIMLCGGGVVAGLALLLTGCGAQHPAVAHLSQRVPVADRSHRVASAAARYLPVPSWCGPALARAINGDNAVRLIRYEKYDSHIRDLFQAWTLTLGMNGLLPDHPHWSISRLLNSAPVTTGSLYQAASADIPYLNRLCDGTGQR